MKMGDVSFREISAWVMAGACGLSGVIYFGVTAEIYKDTGQLVPPIVPFVAAVLILIIAAIVGHVITAILSPLSINDAADERDRWIALRASHISGLVLGFGVVMSLLLNLISVDNSRLFHMVFGALLAAQITEYGVSIIGYRKLSAQGEV